MNLKNKNLGFLMTRNMSLNIWDTLGIIDRELKPYKELAKHFNAIYIFSYGSNDNIFSSHLPSNVIIISKPKFFNNLLYSFLLPLINRKIFKKLDIIKTNQMDGSWSAVFAKKFFSIKIVVRCGYEWLYTLEKSHKSFFKKIIAKNVENFAYSNADKIILTSEEIRKFVLRNFKVNNSIIDVIQNYIDINLFKPINISKERNRIIFIGRLEPEKNLVNLFNSLVGVNATLVVIGNGSLRYELEKLSKENNLNVIFMGNIPQLSIPDELNKSQLFILPSLYEGNPKALLEAMSCGLPCIGTSVEGILSVINHGENGFICNTDPESLRKSINFLLENKGVCDKLGHNARAYVEENNSLQGFINKELHIYKSFFYEKSL